MNLFFSFLFLVFLVITPARALVYSNNIIYASENGMVCDYLTGPPVPGSYSGAVNSAFTDNVGAWNVIMSSARKGDTVVLPPGYCGFKSAPAATPDYVKIVGAGGMTWLVKSYTSGSEEIFITPGIYYAAFENIGLLAANGYQGGVAFGRIATNANDAPYGIRAENIIVTFLGNGSWQGGIKINGAAGGLNYGTRAHVFKSWIIKATFFGIQLTACNACEFNGVIPDTPWGIWLISVADNPTTNFYASGVLQCSVLSYGARTSMIHGAVVGQIILGESGTSGVTSGVSVYAGYLSTIPTIAGTNNYVYGNGQKWP